MYSQPPTVPGESGSLPDAAHGPPVRGDLARGGPADRGAAGGGGRRAEAASWAVLAVLVAGTVYLQAAAAPQVSLEQAVPADRADLILQGQYLLGIAGLAERAAPGVFDTLPGVSEGDLASGLARTVHEPRDHLALAPVYAELGRAEEARVLVERVGRISGGGGQAPGTGPADGWADAGAPPADPELIDEARAFSGLLEEPPRLPDPASEQRLLGTYGWFAELALARARGGEPLDELLGRARRVALAVVVAIPVALGCLALGTLLLGWALLRHAEGKLGWAYPRTVRGQDVPSRLPYLETVVVFVVALQMMGLVTGSILLETDSLWPLGLNWLILPLIFWPMVRGRPPARVLADLGWHRGRSVAVEVVCGLVAYLAATPILAAGLALSMLVSAFGDTRAYHPVVDWIGSDSALALPMIFLLAALWAPIVEESVFRGAFYHYLRGRWGMLASALVVALVFACLHPQGWVGLPFLVSLATVLAVVREWRGSLVACVTIHVVHNSLAVTLMALLFR